MATCSIESCAKASRAGGMCEPHYRRAKDYGDPLYMHEKVCVECGGPFRTFHKSTRVCSDDCKRARARASYRTPDGSFTCATCAKPLFKSRTSAPQGKARCLQCRRTHGSPGAYKRGCRCAECRTANAARANAYMAAHKAKHGEAYSSTLRRKFKAEYGFWPQGSGTEFVDAPTRRAIYERDGWTCQLCFGAVGRDAAEHADRASLDHIVPQSRGGSHDPSNLRMAHVGCNARRGDRVDDLEGVA